MVHLITCCPFMKWTGRPRIYNKRMTADQRILKKKKGLTIKSKLGLIKPEGKRNETSLQSGLETLVG